jgi:hypothetical protein
MGFDLKFDPVAFNAFVAKQQEKSMEYKVIFGRGRYDYIPQDEDHGAAEVIAHHMGQDNASTLTDIMNAFSVYRRD